MVPNRHQKAISSKDLIGSSDHGNILKNNMFELFSRRCIIEQIKMILFEEKNQNSILLILLNFM